MKLKLILAIFTVGISCLVTRADDGFSVFAAGGGKQNGTNFVVIPSQSAQYKAQPVITFLSATGTNAAAVLNFYMSTNQTVATTTNITTSVNVNSTNGFVAGNVVVLQHLTITPRLQYERLVIASVQNTNGMTFTFAPNYPILKGDVINQEVVMSTLPIGASTVTLTGPGIVSGQRAEPWLIDEGGSTNTTINAVNSIYLQ